ncbi:DUF835 domain-containing protein, partial [bacterium]|nr:DUF835 domain-containing protein [bacterium]
KYCFEVFEEALSKGLNGLCITRMHPQQIKNSYTSIAKGSQVLWLTDRESVKESPTVSPMISNVNSIVEDFIDNNPRAVLLFDGLEYLISVNSFKPVLFFIEGIKDKIAENEVSLLFSVSPMTFDQKQLKTLERVMEIVADGEKLQIELAPKESAMAEAPKELADAKPETKVKEVSNVIADKIAEGEQVGEGMIDGELESELAPKLFSKDKLELETATRSASDLPSTEPTEDERPVSSATTGIVLDDKAPCRSCEGTGKCIWCDEKGNCETCKGTGKGSNDEPCADCNGSGKCRSCEGSGKCRWCKGEG